MCPMDAVEQRMFADVVKLVNRTEKPLEFQWDSILYVVVPGKPRMLPRHIALKGIQAHNIKIDPSTGLVTESMMGIDEERTRFPVDMLSKDLDIQEIKESHKLDDEPTVLVDGRSVKKKVVDLKPRRDDFSGNNS